MDLNFEGKQLKLNKYLDFIIFPQTETANEELYMPFYKVLLEIPPKVTMMFILFSPPKEVG